MITEKDGVFHLNTDRTSYVFRVTKTGQPEHLYYGRRIGGRGNFAEAFCEKQSFLPGNSICYDAQQPSVSLESFSLEMSASGKGDLREPLIELIQEDGSRTCDFVYQSFAITEGKQPFLTLPGSYDEADHVTQLTITLEEKNYHQKLELFYWTFDSCDVITRSVRLTNEGEKTILVERLLSMQLDLPGKDYEAEIFTGVWAREMHRDRIRIPAGKLELSSSAGTSSNRANPFFILEKQQTSEDFGECFAVNLIYSGNHYEAVEASPYGKTRVVTGIQPRGFSYVLEHGESLEAPEAVLSYSTAGRNGLSKNMHSFVREHIVRGYWKKRERPVLINSWEAFYFDFTESKLLRLAQSAKNVGIELFVLDDGWFGDRQDDTTSLGDWWENLKKLPGGLSGLSEKIEKLGLKFGLWVEPEMVSVKSRLYEQHPEWVLENPAASHSEGRNQRILDLGNPQVQEFIISEMSRIFKSAKISYVKWDMNRIFSDAYSKYLPKERQGEVMHRYQIGLYRCMKELTEAFPEILFEGCASGGNRFDLGILCYFPQIWASDNTDACCRAQIQNGYSYGYPQSVISAHVSSCPNHQTLRVTPLETRFSVAAFGVLGYECNLTDRKAEELEEIRQQIELYKKWRKLLQFGQLYRGKCFDEESGRTDFLGNADGNLQEWHCVSEEGSQAVMLFMQRFAIPNSQSWHFRVKGLKEEGLYHFYNLPKKYDIRNFGDLINTQAPIHIRQDSLLHNMVARFVKMEGETEDYRLDGASLMHGGVQLKQPYGGTGYDETVRYFPDFASRMYFAEEIQEEI